jgi:hypothetical protein
VEVASRWKILVGTGKRERKWLYRRPALDFIRIETHDILDSACLGVMEECGSRVLRWGIKAERRKKPNRKEGQNMKCHRLSAIFLAVGVFLFGGTSSLRSQGVDQTQGGETQRAQTGQAEMKPAAQVSGQSDAEEKEGFRKKADRTIRDLDKKISVLGKKVKKQGSQIKKEAKESWEEVKAKQKVAEKKLKELSSAGEETWEKVKSEVNAAMDDLKKAYDKTVAYFK